VGRQVRIGSRILTCCRLYKNRQTILNALNGLTEDPETKASPTAEDQLRLVIIYYLTVPDNAISKDDMNELTNVLKLAGADLKALEYVKK
jgi:hypothetical protein